jgi:hypothetical protein
MIEVIRRSRSHGALVLQDGKQFGRRLRPDALLFGSSNYSGTTGAVSRG